MKERHGCRRFTSQSEIQEPSARRFEPMVTATSHAQRTSPIVPAGHELTSSRMRCSQIPPIASCYDRIDHSTGQETHESQQSSHTKHQRWMHQQPVSGAI